MSIFINAYRRRSSSHEITIKDGERIPRRKGSYLVVGDDGFPLATVVVNGWRPWRRRNITPSMVVTVCPGVVIHGTRT